jgi:hypothetical protein
MRSQRGQIIIVTPILILLMIGAFLLAMNISLMARERIKIQVAADAAARDGAYIQAQALSAIGILNDAIMAADSEIADGISMLDDPFTFLEGLAMIEEGHEAAESAADAQDAISDATPAVAEAAVVAEADANGGYIGSVVPGLSTVELQLERTWAFWPFVGLLVREQDEIEEKIVVALYKDGGQTVYGNALLKGQGGDLEFPSLIADSAARPYWYAFGHDPRDASVPSWGSMVVGGYGWEAKLESAR